MKTAIRAIMALSIATAMISCAKTTEDDTNALEQLSLEEWIKTHAPGAIPLTEGIYYEVVQPAPDGAEEISGLNWLLTEYEIKDMSGNPVYTRSEETARRLGTYSEYTHYVPDMMFLGTKSSSSTMPSAMFHALGQMRVGEVWRLYSPSRHIFNSKGFNNVVGYGGQYPLEAGLPVIIDNLKVVEVIGDPDRREREMIAALVTSPAPEGWGMSEADSLKSHFYLQRLNPDNEGEEIREGSTAWIYYKAMFMDGTLLDSNIDSVWTNRFGGIRYRVNEQNVRVPVEDTAAVGINRRNPAEVFTNMPKKAFGFLFEKDGIRYDDSMRMVVTSLYAYGDTGRMGYDGFDATYNYNRNYYSQGGYAEGDFGAAYYDLRTASVYNFYNTFSSSTILEPMPEVKPFTPIVYEFVVRKPNIQ